MKKCGLIITFWLFVCSTFGVVLEWDPSPDETNGFVGGYSVHYGTNSGNYPVGVDVGTNLSLTIPDTNLVGGMTYWFVARAYSTNNLESDNSNEVSYTPAAPPPPELPLPSKVEDFRLAPPPEEPVEPSITNGLVVYYSFENIDNTLVLDDSGNGCDGLLYGNPTFVQRSGGNALNIANRNQYVIGEKINVTTNGTISVWFMATNAINNDMILGNGNWQTDRNGFIFAEYNVKPYFELNDATGKNQYSPNLSLVGGIWKMWTFTWDGTNISCFTNGIYFGQVPQTKIPPTDVYPFSVAVDGSRIYRLTSGNIDEVRVYNRALSTEEIFDLYNSTK